MSDEFDLDEATELLARSHHIVALTGAGISTDSGIADFRGPNGLWTKDPEAERRAQLSVYVSEPDVRISAWANRLAFADVAAQPNAGHRALVDLERRGTLDAIVTQNIDGLHQDAGSDPDLIIEIHGTTRYIVCLRCANRLPAPEVLDRVRQGEADPHCLRVIGGTVCGGLLKSATISFGQSLVAEDLVRAERVARHCDLMLAIGTTLGVYPAAGLVPEAVSHGARCVIINDQPTPYDEIADVVLRQPISEVLPRLVEGSIRTSNDVA